MGRFVVLLRGVNVGRGNRVPMADFRLALESLGHTDVKTLLNSGNAVFTSSKRTSTGLAAPIRAALKSRLGVDVPVIVKSMREIRAIEGENSLAARATDDSRLLVAFTPDAQSLRGLGPLAAVVRAPERLLIGKHAAYLWCAHGILESAAGKALLGKVGGSSTTRNWATVIKISALLNQSAA